MPLYETLLFVRSKVTPASLVGTLKKCVGTLAMEGGVVRSVENLGKRALAYPMRKAKKKCKFAHLIRIRSYNAPRKLLELNE